jgi:hypothetical protein
MTANGFWGPSPGFVVKTKSAGESNYSIKFKRPNGETYELPNVHITSIRTVNNERIQSETGFNETFHIGAFGRDPVRAAVSGFISRSSSKPNFESAGELAHVYREELRAFSAAKNGKSGVVIYGPHLSGSDNNILSGIAVSMTCSVDAQNPSICEFSMEFLEVPGSILAFGAEENTKAGTIQMTDAVPISTAQVTA